MSAQPRSSPNPGLPGFRSPSPLRMRAVIIHSRTKPIGQGTPPEDPHELTPRCLTPNCRIAQTRKLWYCHQLTPSYVTLGPGTCKENQGERGPTTTGTRSCVQSTVSKSATSLTACSGGTGSRIPTDIQRMEDTEDQSVFIKIHKQASAHLSTHNTSI